MYWSPMALGISFNMYISKIVIIYCNVLWHMDQDTECIYNNTIFIQTQVLCYIFIVKCIKYLFVVSAELSYYYKCQRHYDLPQMKFLVSNLISASEYFMHFIWNELEWTGLCTGAISTCCKYVLKLSFVILPWMNLHLILYKLKEWEKNKSHELA